MKMRRIFLICIMIFCFCILPDIYANDVNEVLNPLEGEITENITSLATIVFIMLGAFAILSLIERIIAGKKSTSTKMLSNKGIRFLEVLFLIILLVLLGYEYMRIGNLAIKCIGVLLCLFVFYQRVSNKNRRWAYIALTLNMLLYIGINIFK